MAKNRAEWASGHRQLTRIGLSDGCGGELIPVAVQSGYHRNKFEGHLGNVGLKHPFKVPSLAGESSSARRSLPGGLSFGRVSGWATGKIPLWNQYPDLRGLDNLSP